MVLIRFDPLIDAALLIMWQWLHLFGLATADNEVRASCSHSLPEVGNSLGQELRSVGPYCADAVAGLVVLPGIKAVHLHMNLTMKGMILVRARCGIQLPPECLQDTSYRSHPCSHGQMVLAENQEDVWPTC